MIYIGFISEIFRFISGIDSRGAAFLITTIAYFFKFRAHSYSKSHFNLIIYILFLAPFIINLGHHSFNDSFLYFLALIAFVILLPGQFFVRLINDFSWSKIHFYIVMFLALVAVAQYRLEMGMGNATVLFFSEPAHFVRELAVVSSLLVASINQKSFYLKNIFMYLFLGLLFPSLLSLVIAFVFIGLYLKLHAPNRFKFDHFIIYVFLAIICSIFISTSTDLEYFSSRLSFSANLTDMNNLTTLVFLQGYENAYLVLKESFLGTGIGQAAHASTGQVSDRIYELTGGRSLNLEDAGSLAAKIMIEFGWPGVFINLFVIIFSVRQVFSSDKSLESRLLQNISAVFLTFFLLRSSGYFTSVNFFMMLLMLYSGRLKHVGY